MKSLPIVVASLLGASPVLAEDTSGKPSTDPNPDVRIEGDTLIYLGAINENGLEALSEAVRDLPRGR